MTKLPPRVPTGKRPSLRLTRYLQPGECRLGKGCNYLFAVVIRDLIPHPCDMLCSPTPGSHIPHATSNFPRGSLAAVAKPGTIHKALTTSTQAPGRFNFHKRHLIEPGCSPGQEVFTCRTARNARRGISIAGTHTRVVVGNGPRSARAAGHPPELRNLAPQHFRPAARGRSFHCRCALGFRDRVASLSHDRPYQQNSLAACRANRECVFPSPRRSTAAVLGIT